MQMLGKRGDTAAETSPPEDVSEGDYENTDGAPEETDDLPF
jgi:hypothetical protein